MFGPWFLRLQPWDCLRGQIGIHILLRGVKHRSDTIGQFLILAGVGDWLVADQKQSGRIGIHFFTHLSGPVVDGKIFFTTNKPLLNIFRNSNFRDCQMIDPSVA